MLTSPCLNLNKSLSSIFGEFLRKLSMARLGQSKKFTPGKSRCLLKQKIWFFRLKRIHLIKNIVGARVSAKNRGDDTPLHNAAQTGKLDVAKVRVLRINHIVWKYDVKVFWQYKLPGWNFPKNLGPHFFVKWYLRTVWSPYVKFPLFLLGKNLFNTIVLKKLKWRFFLFHIVLLINLLKF